MPTTTLRDELEALFATQERRGASCHSEEVLASGAIIQRGTIIQDCPRQFVNGRELSILKLTQASPGPIRRQIVARSLTRPLLVAARGVLRARGILAELGISAEAITVRHVFSDRIRTDFRIAAAELVAV